jgi:methionine-rich copper-binding protein CopC
MIAKFDHIVVIITCSTFVECTTKLNNEIMCRIECDMLQKPVYLLFLTNKVFIFIVFFVTSLAASLFLYDNSAYGHANPVSYSPSANSIINQQSGSLPAKVEILFSERPEPKVSYIHVTNYKNERIDNNDFQITGQKDRESAVTLDKSKLSNGVYTVSWLVLSRDDGHITKGSYVFNIQATEQQQPSHEIIAAPQNNNTFFSEQATVDNVNLKLDISSLNVGQNTFNVTLIDRSDNPPTNIKNVIMAFTNKEAGLGPIVANLNKTEEAEFVVRGSYLSQSGEWEIKATVQRTGAYDQNHTFKVMAKSPTNNTASS